MSDSRSVTVGEDSDKRECSATIIERSDEFTFVVFVRIPIPHKEWQNAHSIAVDVLKQASLAAHEAIEETNRNAKNFSIHPKPEA